MERGILKYHLLAFIAVCVLVWGGCQEMSDSEVRKEFNMSRTDRLELTGFGKLVDTLHIGESFYSYDIMHDKESDREFAVIWFRSSNPVIVYLGKDGEE